MKKLVLLTMTLMSLSMSTAFAVLSHGSVIVGPGGGGGGGGGCCAGCCPDNPNVGTIDSRLDVSMLHGGADVNPVIALPGSLLHAGIIRDAIRTRPTATGCTAPAAGASLALQISYRRCMAIKATGTTKTETAILAMKDGSNHCESGYFKPHDDVATVSLSKTLCYEALALPVPSKFD